MSSAPYTVYPDPADNPYLIGIPCPHCGAGADDRCLTSGGNVYAELCHKKRRDAASAADTLLKVVKPPSTRDPDFDPDIPDKVNSLKLAFWYIEKIGGVERARSYFNAATSALDALPEDDE